MAMEWRNTIHCGDNLKVMRGMAGGAVSLAITSPPYVDARTYGIGFKLKGMGWVDWMIPRVIEMCRVTDGLVFVNMAGKVKDWQYQPVVEWLVADLTREHGIVCGPAPYVFHRIGIPGSGSKHYHRRDWEPVYAFARAENLPPKWSDNTCMGHPPKWAPGGEMSYRIADGARVNQWGHSLESGGTVVDDGGVVRSKGKWPSHRDAHGFTLHNGEPSETQRKNGAKRTTNKSTREQSNEFGSRDSHDGCGRIIQVPGPDGKMILQGYDAPVLANPGNLIQESYTADEVAALLSEGSDVTHHLVGGGVMGSKLAHENEAPFPLTLCEFFIRSFAPEGGIVLDPFCGSGSVLAACEKWGRCWLGIDVRESQVKLSQRRIKEVEKPLFKGN